MIPTPFVLNDAVVIMQTIKQTSKPVVSDVVKKFYPKTSEIIKGTIQKANETN